MWWDIYRRWTLSGVVRRIRRHGWTATYVPGQDGVPFSYSVGFWESAGAPEVIMFGAPMDVANGMIAEAFRRLKTGELKLSDQARWTLDWMEGGPAFVWRAVHPSQIRREHFNIAIWYRERQGQSRSGLEAYQLFISDEAGRFPWEDGYDPAPSARQTELYLPFLGPLETDA